MQILKATVCYLFLHLTVLFIDVHARCRLVNNDLPKVTNGYRSNVDNVKLYSDNTAQGYYDVSCQPGFALNPDIGGRITCLSTNAWSKPLPQCKSTGRCTISTLFKYLQNTDGIHIIQSLSFIYTDGNNDNQALGGSNITVECSNGYVYSGGPLTIVCTKSNSWTTFPKCTYNSSATVPTVSPPVGCPYTEDTLDFDNGHLSNTKNLLIYDGDIAQGYVEVTCSAGYVIDSVSGGVYKCTGQTWSPRPYCTKTPRCSLPTLQNFLNDYNAVMGLKISSQHLLQNSDETNEILIGSNILFTCKSGYKNTDNNLNVVCNADGQWTPFPACISLATTTKSANKRKKKRNN